MRQRRQVVVRGVAIAGRGRIAIGQRGAARQRIPLILRDRPRRVRLEVDLGHPVHRVVLIGHPVGVRIPLGQQVAGRVVAAGPAIVVLVGPLDQPSGGVVGDAQRTGARPVRGLQHQPGLVVAVADRARGLAGRRLGQRAVQRVVGVGDGSARRHGRG